MSESQRPSWPRRWLAKARAVTPLLLHAGWLWTRAKITGLLSPSSAPRPRRPRAPKQETRIRTIAPNSRLELALWSVVLLVCLGLALLAALSWSDLIWSRRWTVGDRVISVAFNYGFLWLVPIPFILFSCLREVAPNELGAAYFFGTYFRALKPGLYLLPPFANIRTYPRDLQTIREPGPRDKIFWGDEKEALPAGMVRPIFVTSRPPAGDEHDPLDVQMTIGLGYEVLWTIEDPATFYANVHSIPEANDQIKLISETCLNEVVSGFTTDDAITKQKEINGALADRLREETKDWGIGVQNAGLTIINLSHPLATVMRNRAEAEFQRQTRVIKAEGEAKEIELLGEAQGKAARAKESGPLVGRAEGLAAMAKVLQVPGSEIYAGEIARETLPHVNATLFGAEGVMQAAGLAAIFGAGLKATKGSTGEASS